MILPKCLLLLAIIALFLAGCGVNKKPDLIVLHTGRILGNVYPTSLKGLAPLQYYPLLSGYIRSVRAEAEASGAQVLLVDSGDSLHGSFASEVTGCGNTVDFFNYLGYDAVVLGNLDALVSPEQVAGLKAKLLVPFELTDGTPAFPGAHFSGVFNKGHLKVGIIANFYGDLPWQESPTRFPSYYQNNPSLTVRPVRRLEQLASELSHQKTDYRLLNWFKFESPEEPPAFAHAAAKSGMDLVLAHRIYSSKLTDVWGTKEYQAWPVPVSENIRRENRGYTVARCDLRRDQQGHVQVLSSRLIALSKDSAQPDPDITALMEKYSQAILSADAPVAQLSQNLGRDAIQSLYLRSLASRSSAGSVAVYSPESIRSGWMPGTLTRSALFESLPWKTPTVEVRTDAATFAKIISGSTYTWYGSPPTGDKEVRIVTSAYFGKLMLLHHAIPQENLTILDTKGEFELFASWLSKQTSDLAELSTAIMGSTNFHPAKP